MIRNLVLGTVVVATLGAGSHTTGNDHVPRGTPPDTIPALFAEGVVSTGDNEFSTALTPDGNTVYRTVSAPNPFDIPFVVLSSSKSTTTLVKRPASMK